MPSLAVLALLVAGQVPVDEPSIEQELDALIVRTNALVSFRALYSVVGSGEDPGAGQGTLELVYLAPDRGRVMMSGAFGKMNAWASGRSFIAQVATAGNEEKWVRYEVPEPSRAAQLLDELFPREDRPLETGVIFDIGVKESGFQMSVMAQATRREALLKTLLDLQRLASEVQRADDTLVWTGSTFRLEVSRSTGFPERLEFQFEGKHGRFVLEELSLDQAVDEGLLAWPEVRAEVPFDPEVTRALEWVNAPGTTRKAAFLRLEAKLVSGERTWDARTRADWEQFLEALHEDQVRASYGDYLGKLHDHVDGIEAWLRERRKADSGGEQLRADCAKARETLAEQLDDTRHSYLESLPEISSKDAAPRAELFAAENEIAGRAFDDLVRVPILKEFDETIAAVFDE